MHHETARRGLQPAQVSARSGDDLSTAAPVESLPFRPVTTKTDFMPHPIRPLARARSTARLLAAAAWLAGLGIAPAWAEPLILDPLYAGTFGSGPGASAAFHRIDNGWRGSQVLWDQQARQYGSGVPIGSFAGWGSGIWGYADWQQVLAAAASPGQVGAPDPVQSWTGRVEAINHGNSRYNECHAGTWGAASLLPFFTDVRTGADCGDAEAGALEQQNWISHFSGFVRIVDPGAYNFSVLYDDGYFFRLVGAGGQSLGIEEDFLNPRQREGFDSNLLLGAGLYGFELGSWNRLGAGVVDLRWSRGDGDWTLVPTEHLLPAGAVPEPQAALLAALALLALALARRAAA